MGYEEHKESLKERGVPRSFTNWVKSHLSRGGMSTDQVDIEANYDPSLTYRENQANFEKSYPVESMERRIGGYSERQQRAIEKETEMELARQEKEALEREYMESPDYEKAGRLAQLRKIIQEEYAEPDISNEISQSAKELGIEEIRTHTSKPRKQSNLEKFGEEIKEFGSDTASFGFGIAKGAWGVKKEYEKYKKEQQLSKLRELSAQSRTLTLAERNQALIRRRMKGMETKGHPGNFAYSQVGNIDFGIKSQNINLGVGQSKPVFNGGTPSQPSHNLAVGSPKPFGFALGTPKMFSGLKSGGGFGIGKPNYSNFFGKKGRK